MTNTLPFAAAQLSVRTSIDRASFNLCRSRFHYRSGAQTLGHVTLLRAPIGFGKTTLLKQWLEEAKLLRQRVGWLNLTVADRSSDGLVSSLVKAGVLLHGREPMAATDAIAHSLTSPDRSEHSLFLDNWDVILGSESAQIIARLANQGLLRANLYIATRRAPDLPLDVLMANNQLRLIGQNALKFSDKEQRRLLGVSYFGSISAELLAACDGWPLAVKLLKCVELDYGADCLSPQIFAQESGLIEMLTRPLQNACTEAESALLEILGLSPDVDVTLLNSVRGTTDAGVLLEGVASLLPFQTYVDDRGLRYRPSELVRPIFQRHFDDLGPQRQHLIAAQAYEKALGFGRTLDAINFALLSGEAEKAVDLLEEIGPLRLMMIYGVEAIQNVLRRLPLPLMAKSFRSRLAVPITYAKRGCLVEAREMVDETVRDIESSALDPVRRQLALRDAVFARMQIAACSDGDWADAYEKVARSELAKEPAFAAWSKVCSGIVNHQMGRLDAADVDFDQALFSCEQISATYQLLHLRVHRAHVNLARGNLRGATRLFREIKGNVRASYPWEIGLHAIAEIGRIEASLMASRSSIQLEALTNALANLRQGDGWYEPFASALVSMGHILWRDEGLDAVIRGLDAVAAELQQRGITHVDSILVALKAFYLTLDGHCAAAEALLHVGNGWEETANSLPMFWRERHLRGLVHSMIAASGGRKLEALEIADGLISSCRKDGRKLALVEAYVNRGRVLLADTAQRQDAMRSLASGLELANDLDAPGVLYEWRTELTGQACGLEACLQPRTVEMFGRLRDEWQGKYHRDLLSDRERAVLKGVAAGLTNKEISRELDISVDTIKFHLKQCFRKLNAQTRSGAVETARTARLL